MGGWRTSFALQLVLLTVLVTVSLTTGQNAVCCGVKIMDSSRKIALEADWQLTQGTFRALRVKVCSTDPIWIQIYTRVADRQYAFKWQTKLRPTSADTTAQSILISFANSPVVITGDDRLAMYNPRNHEMKFSVPYEFSETDSLYYSELRYDDNKDFSLNERITTDDLRYPRTFRNYIVFCPDDNCQGRFPLYGGVDGVGSPGPIGPPGPVGPPGPCCSTPISCDPGEIITSGLQDQNRRVQDIQEKVEQIDLLVKNLAETGNFVTGLCPPGFFSGSLGLGSCYYVERSSVQLGEAIIRCRDQFRAKVLAVETAQEQIFLKNVITNTTLPIDGREESFWTTGMFNRQTQTWVWYDDITRTKVNFHYNNWVNGTEPYPRSDIDICMAVTMNSPIQQSYWSKVDCISKRFFICEIPKACL